MWASVYHVCGGERTSNSGCQAGWWVYHVYGGQRITSVQRGFWGTKLWLPGCVASAFLGWGSPRLKLLSNVGTVKIMGILGDELKIEFALRGRYTALRVITVECYKKSCFDVRLTKGQWWLILLPTWEPWRAPRKSVKLPCCRFLCSISETMNPNKSSLIKLSLFGTSVTECWGNQ